MKRLFLVISLMLGMLLTSALPAAYAADAAPAATPASADSASAPQAKAKTKKRVGHTRFSCTREECVCHGGADCNDLGSTRLCKIDMNCNGQTCRCSRN